MQAKSTETNRINKNVFWKRKRFKFSNYNCIRYYLQWSPIQNTCHTAVVLLPRETSPDVFYMVQYWTVVLKLYINLNV